MAEQNIVRIDNIKWWVTKDARGNRLPVSLCPEHDLRLQPVPPRIRDAYRGGYKDGSYKDATKLKCEEGPHELEIPRKYKIQQNYVLDRIDAKVFKGMKVLNLDDEVTPIAKTKVQTKDGKHYVKAQLMESKRGVQVVIYAGEKGKSKKSQIFISPDEKRLSFDHKDLHPSDVFLKLEAQFDDGTKSKIEK